MDVFPLGGGLAQVCTVYEQFGKGVSGWKRPVGKGPSGKAMAEGEGFEPPEPRGSTVFKTAAIDHSATPPVASIRRLGAWCATVQMQLTLLSPFCAKQEAD